MNNFEIAHIRAANEGGRRYVARMTDEERNSFDNLVLLCIVHHKIVDKIRPDEFSIEVLEAWKDNREGPGHAALRGLRSLTEDRLQDLIAASFADVTAQIDEAVDRLSAIDAEAASLLRPLVEQLAESKFTSRYPNEDVAAMLLRAGQKLGHLEDSAATLSSAADRTAGLQDGVVALDAVVERLAGLLENFNAVERRLGRFRSMM
ncbi:hypothetical protein ACQPYA_03845 [Micromonospora sp. CA-263727]|uniref:hypothetical protein n=1 Tax=Micromonospora sp. CA-263727 TaxID=3239967 RepID=UPI003D910723